MFEHLSNQINRAIKTLKGNNQITELNITTALRDIRRALIEADVNYKVAKKITEDIKERALGQAVLTAVSPGQLFTKIVSDELTTIMGSEQSALQLQGNPATIMVAGLQGSGKTTFCGKLAHYLTNKNQSVLLVACDRQRPAAVEQLQTLAKQIGVEVYGPADRTDTLAIAEEGIEYAKKTHKKVVIIDTAGRQTVDENMMREIKTIKNKIQPTETLFVADAMMGQDAVATAQAFHDQLSFDGIVLTKLDGDTRGGAVLSIRTVINKPIKFTSTGEKINDLDLFHPNRMAQRILGMGDIVSLVEKAEAVYDKEQEKKLNQKIRKNQFDFNDFYTQIQQLKKMGNIEELIKLIPGMSKMMTNVGPLQTDQFKYFETLIHSMTPQERSHPTLLTVASRRTRIAKGCGLPLTEVNRLINQFEALGKFMKKAQKSNIQDILPIGRRF
jgi:signal recognition particle subunit SRP54